MFVEEYGKENKKIIVMLHGIYDVHSFRKQYELSKKYKIVIPHLMGFGKMQVKIYLILKSKLKIYMIL